MPEFVCPENWSIWDHLYVNIFWTFQRQAPVYLHNLPPNIKNPCRQAANGRVHCDEQNCRKDKNGEQECRSRVHTFQATPNGYISIEEQLTNEERFQKIQLHRKYWSERISNREIPIGLNVSKPSKALRNKPNIERKIRRQLQDDFNESQNQRLGLKKGPDY